MDFNGVGVRDGQAAPEIMKRSIWSYYPPRSLFPVSVDDWPWSVLWLWSGLWAAQTLAERPGTAQLGTACHSWPAAQADGQQPNSPISIWSGLNQMPSGELYLEWPWNWWWWERSSWSWCLGVRLDAELVERLVLVWNWFNDLKCECRWSGLDSCLGCLTNYVMFFFYI